MIKGGDGVNKKDEIECCETTEIHEDLLCIVRDKLPPEDDLYDLAELFKVFGDSTRMKIICALLQGELCVCDIAYIINSTVSAVSHQLRILKQAKLVKYHKEGKVVYYSLDDEHVYEIFKKGCEHIEEV